MKKIILWLLLVAFYMWWTYWLDIGFDFFNRLFKTKISIIHFYNGSETNPQDSLWLLILKDTKSLDTPEEIKLEWETIKCNQQLRWYYINAVRWNYILPLTEDDKTSMIGVLNGDTNINVIGWFFTSCDKWKYNSIYWNIKYKYNNTDWFDIYAGFNYNLVNNSINFGSWFVNSFILSNGVKPVWFLYDSVWWVWFVWWNIKKYSISSIQNNILDKLTSSKWIEITYVWDDMYINDKKIWDSTQSARVKSLIGLVWAYSASDSNFQTNPDKKLVLKQMFSDEHSVRWTAKLAYQIWNVWNVAKIRNKVKKNAESICAWRWENGVGTNIFNMTPTWTDLLKKINCFDAWNDVGKIIIDYDVSLWDYDPVIITKWNIDVIIKKPMTWPHHLDLFVDKWKMMIDNSIDIEKITKNGDYTSANAVTSWAIIKWTFIINGLLWWTDGNNFVPFPHKLYVQWMLSSLNTISTPKENRIDYVNEVLWENGDSYWKDNINLTKVFSWRCTDVWVWTDGVNCSNQDDRWWQNSIIFLKRNYNSILLK